MDQPASGDTELAARAARRLGSHHDRFVVAEVADGVIRTAEVGLPAGSDLEIGSVSKGLTGMLFADSRERGETRDSTRLGTLLPLDGTPLADVVLGDLATHTSGLPRLAASSGALRATWELWTRGTNPYGETLDELLVATRRTGVGRARPRYSNVGLMLLGHALATAAGTSYAGLLRERLTAPLGMDDTIVPATPMDLGPASVQGRSARGRPMEPWTGEALGPAGGIRSTAADLGSLLRGLLGGSAPGVRALDPVARFSGPLRIGAAWMTIERKGTALTWHDGGTGGFRSVVVLDRAAGAGVAVVSATARSVDQAGFALLKECVREAG